MKDLIRERLGRGAKISLRVPLAHQSNRLYDVYAQGKHWIAKEYLKTEEFFKAPVREHKTLEIFSHLDIAPQPGFHAPLSENIGPVVVYEFLEGVMWDRKKPTSTQLEQLAELWLKMHSVTEKAGWLSRGYRFWEKAERFEEQFQYYLNWARAHFPEWLRLEKTWIPLLEQWRKNAARINELGWVDAYGRGDPRFANVIQRPNGQLGMVDWEDAGLRDPALDIADMITHPNQEDLLDEREWDSFTGPYYAARRAIDPEIPARVKLYQFIINMYRLSFTLNWGVRLANEGKLHSWRINDMAPEQRTRRFLAKCLAWPDGDFNQYLRQAETYRFF